MHIPKQLSDRQWDLYCVGNGRMAAYWNRGEMEGLFGPSYSAPDMLTLRHADAVRAAAPSVRRAQSAVWDTALEQSGEPAGSLTVFACREFPAVVVRVHALRPVRYRLGYSPGLNAGAEPPRENSGLRGQNGWLWQIRAGNYLYMDYPTPYPIWCQTLLRGAVHAQADGDGVLCTFAPGNSELWLIGGPDYAALAENAAQALALSAAQAERDCLTAWAQVYAAADLEARIPKDAPRREELLRAADSTIAVILSQQAEEGAVLAGHCFHLGYVRDQYGVCRALLRLGLTAQAKSLLEFHRRNFEAEGVITNAHAVAYPGLRHVGENDGVEITGYLILEILEYCRMTGDWAYARQSEALMRWAYASQRRCLADNMLPFNGDETYIAGGVLPRQALCDGSAEATMLFVLSGEALLGWMRESGIGTAVEQEEMADTLRQVRAAFAGNFLSDGMLYANNPARDKCGDKPVTTGVCQNCGQVFGPIQKGDNGLYNCLDCLMHRPAAKRYEPVRYRIASVDLAPAFMGCDFIDPAIVLRTAAERTAQLQVPAADAVEVGYDLGLLLYALAKSGAPERWMVYDLLLDRISETGAWTERYVGGQIDGCRYRPWESAINLVALLACLEAPDNAV